MKKSILLFSFIIPFAFSCQNQEGSSEEAQISSDAIENERTVISNGSLDILGSKDEKADSIIYHLNTKYEAFIANSSQTSSDEYSKDFFSIKIPAASFEKYVFDLASSPLKIQEKTISREDVTGQVVDLKLRIENKKVLEKKYLELLSNTKTVEEIIQVQSTLNDIRTEIEGMEASMNGTANQVQYSTLRVSVNYPVVTHYNFFKRIWASMETGWSLLIDFIIFLVAFWPAFIIGITIYYFFIRNKTAKIG